MVLFLPVSQADRVSHAASPPPTQHTPCTMPSPSHYRERLLKQEGSSLTHRKGVKAGKGRGRTAARSIVITVTRWKGCLPPPTRRLALLLDFIMSNSSVLQGPHHCEIIGQHSQWDPTPLLFHCPYSHALQQSGHKPRDLPSQGEQTKTSACSLGRGNKGLIAAPLPSLTRHPSVRRVGRESNPILQTPLLGCCFAVSRYQALPLSNPCLA